MWQGTLSGHEFHAESMALIKLWNDFDTSGYHWQWQSRAESSARGYLKLEDMPTTSAAKDERELQLNSDDSEHSVDSIDVATLSLDPLPIQLVASLTYHVIYNESYGVPMLYIQCCSSDGSVLDLNCLQRILTAPSLQLLENSQWTFLTQEDHPFLRRPCFAFHPCGTSSVMAEIFQRCANAPSCSKSSRESDSGNPLRVVTSTSDTVDEAFRYFESSLAGKYLPAWLSIVGQVSRLDVPLNLFRQCSFGSSSSDAQ